VKGGIDRLLPLLIGGGARAVAAGIGLLGTTLGASALGPEGWGVWVVLFAGFGWSTHLSEWGLRNVALVEGGRSGHVCRGLVLDLLRARALPCALAAILLLAGVALWRPPLLLPALWLVAALAAIALGLDWAALIRGSPGPAGLSLVMRPALFLLALLLLPAPLGIGDLAFATFAGWAGAALAGAGEWRRLAGPAPARAQRPPARLLAAGTPFLLLTAANQLAISADLLAVAWMLGAGAAGTFGLVVTVAQAATLGAQASAQWWLARAAEPGLIRPLAEAGLLGALAAAGLAALGPWLLLHLFGTAWQAAAALLPLAGPYVLLVHVSAVLASVACTRGRAGRVVAVQLATQAAAWPLQLWLAGHGGLEAVLLLRGAVELARVVLLSCFCLHRPSPTSFPHKFQRSFGKR
jgi:O-antigen/teichoic acid export membrane protein